MPAKKTWTEVKATVKPLPDERMVLIEFGVRLDAVKLDTIAVRDLRNLLGDALRELESAYTP